MERRIEITVDEAKRVFRFLEKVHHLMHQPIYYQDAEVINKFVVEHYTEAKELYYHVVWSWLPEDVRAEIEDE
jgi:hypothetical protein